MKTKLCGVVGFVEAVRIATVALCVVGSANPSAATTYKYTYTGANFIDFSNPTIYNSSMNVSGWFTTAAPLAPNLPINSLIDPFVLEFSFSDDVNTLTLADLGTLSCTPATNNCWRMETDSAGIITKWVMQITIVWPADLQLGQTQPYIFTENYATLDFGGIETCTLFAAGQCTDYSIIYGARNDGLQGTWTMTEIASPTPLPAALPLFATGLGALGLLGWRKKRKNAAALAAA